MTKSDKKCRKVRKSGKKYEIVVKSCKKSLKVAKSWEKLEKVAKVAKSWKKWRKVGISGKAGEKRGKVGKSWIFLQNGHRRPFWMTKNHFRSHFSPFQINTQLFFLNFFSKWPPAAILEFPFGPFWMTENHFRSHFSPFQINTQLLFFLNIFFKMAASGHFGSPICAKNNRVLPLCVINGYA